MSFLQHLGIINTACARIGQDPVQSLDEDIPGAATAGLLYEEVVDFNLGIYQFSFAKEVRQCSLDDLAVPLTGWTRVFDLPSERLGAPIYISDDASDPDRRFFRYTLSGDQVHCDAEAVVAMIRFRPEPYRWSPAFRSATITGLASRLAYALAADRNGAADLSVEAWGHPSEMYRGGQLGAAIREDSYSAPPRTQNRDDNPLTRSWSS